MTAGGNGTGTPRDGVPKLRIRDLSVSYRGSGRRQLAVDGVDLDLADGEFVALVGPSGCGKSTLLKVVAGLVGHSGGTVELDGQAAGGGVPAGVGLLFQHDALLPWRTVTDNVRFPLAVAGVPAATQRAETQRLIELVGLGGFEAYFPQQLSGGMRKRVALARAMAHDPSLYLMDEPFGPLDAQNRIRLGGEFLALWEQVGKSVLFVTHDVEEAVAMADRVAVMTAGPGRIAAEFDVPLPRPREFHEVRFSEGFRKLHREVWDALEAVSAPQ